MSVRADKTKSLTAQLDSLELCEPFRGTLSIHWPATRSAGFAHAYAHGECTPHDASTTTELVRSGQNTPAEDPLLPNNAHVRLFFREPAEQEPVRFTTTAGSVHLALAGLMHHLLYACALLPPSPTRKLSQAVPVTL